MIWDDDELLDMLQGRATRPGRDFVTKKERAALEKFKATEYLKEAKKPFDKRKRKWTDERRKSFGEARRQRNENSDAHSRLIGAISDAVFVRRAKKRAASRTK